MTILSENQNQNQGITISNADGCVTIDDQAQAPAPRIYDDKWIIIQKTTFTNWINEQLKNDTTETELVSDLQTDLCNGVKLVKLVTILQQPTPKITKKYYKNPLNQHQSIENVALSLNAITEDGIKLVNIGE
jgi:hypothetical protein